MKISYNWLRELVAVDLSPQELRERLTMRGLEVEAIEEAGDDFVLEVAVLSNRADLLSHLGVAREVSVLAGVPVSWPDTTPVRAEGRAENFTAVEIVAPALVPRYSAPIVRAGKVGPAPAGVARRLQAV